MPCPIKLSTNCHTWQKSLNTWKPKVNGRFEPNREKNPRPYHKTSRITYYERSLCTTMAEEEKQTSPSRTTLATNVNQFNDRFNEQSTNGKVWKWTRWLDDSISISNEHVAERIDHVTISFVCRLPAAKRVSKFTVAPSSMVLRASRVMRLNRFIHTGGRESTGMGRVIGVSYDIFYHMQVCCILRIIPLRHP